MHQPTLHSRRGRVALALGLALSLAGDGVSTAEPSRRELWLDAATASAMSGDLKAADSLLVGLLSMDTADPTVLNAMGNVRTLQGRPASARAFYNEAVRHDSTAPGIRLNLANALLELDRDAEAESLATAAIVEVGGLEEARALLGLRPIAAEDSTARGRAAAKPVDRRDIEKLLERAAARVPKMSTGTATKSTQAAKSAQVVSKSGAPRASGPTDSRPALYWGP